MKKIFVTLVVAATLAAPLFGAATREDQSSKIIDWALERYGLKMPDSVAQACESNTRDLMKSSQIGRLNYDLAENTLLYIFNANIGKYLPLIIREKATLSENDGTHSVYSLAYNPQGTLLAAAGSNGAVKLWNMDTYQCEETLTGHTNKATCVAFNNTGKLLASASSDCTIQLWKRTNGNWERIQVLRGHTDEVTSVAFCPTGRFLASASKDKTVKLWNPHSGEFIATIEGNKTSVHSLAFSHDGSHLVSGSEIHAKLCNLETFTCEENVASPVYPIYAMAFSRDDTILAITVMSNRFVDEKIMLYNARTFDHIETLSKESATAEATYCLDFNSDGTLLASGSNEARVTLWDPKNHTYLTTIDGLSASASYVTSIKFSPEAQEFAISLENDGAIRIWGIPDNFTTEQKCCLMLIEEFYNPETDETVPDCFEHIQTVTDISASKLTRVWSSIHNSTN